MRIDNRSGYATTDLEKLFRAAFRACRIRAPKEVVVVSSPIYTRGCAEVSKDRRGAGIVIAIASPAKFSMAKLCRVLEHECAHLRGLDHEDMHDQNLLYSIGPVPAWARGLRLRYVGRAPNQMRRLG